jgi:hypothetical protein
MAEATALRNNALPYPVYGAPWTIIVEIRDNDGDLVTSAAGLDSEISKNADTSTDCTAEATEIGATGRYYLSLTGTELTCDIASIIVKTSTSDAKTASETLMPVKLPVLDSGTAAANEAGATTITLASSAVAIDDYYNGCLVVATIDTVVEARIISDYVGSTKVATVSPAFVQANVDNNDTYVVYQPWGRQFADSNLQGWKSTAAATVHTAGYPVVTVKDGTGTGEIDTTSGGVLVAALANGAITAAAIATDAIDADAMADGAITAATFAAGAIDATAIANGAIDAATFAAGAIDATAIANGAIDAATFAAGAIDAAALAADAGAEIADAFLNRDMSTGTDSGSTTVRTPRQALRFLRNKWDIAAGTLTVTKEDDSTASWTASVSSDASADPVIGTDPAGP